MNDMTERHRHAVLCGVLTVLAAGEGGSVGRHDCRDRRCPGGTGGPFVPAPGRSRRWGRKWHWTRSAPPVRNDVRERRGERGLSQGQLAAAMGVSRQTINALETGRYVPSLPLAMNLATFFEQAVEQLFHLDDTEIR